MRGSELLSCSARRIVPLILLYVAACDDAADLNHPPLAVGTIAEVTIDQGDTTLVDVSGYFSDPDGDALAYSVGTSDTAVVSVSLSGSVVTHTGLEEGSATVTVTAADPDGSEAEQLYGVAITGVPVIDLVVDTASATESEGVTLPLALSKPAGRSIAVSYVLGIDGDPNTVDADSADLAGGMHGTVEVPAGASGIVIEIALKDDDEVESTREVFTVTLDPPVTGAGYQLGSRVSAVATIREGICDRTPVVAAQILRRLEMETCSEVVDEHLSTLYHLAFWGPAGVGGSPSHLGDSQAPACDTVPWFSRGSASRSVRPEAYNPCDPGHSAYRQPPVASAGADGALRSVKAGDFAGLTGLEALDIVRSPIDELPPGVFSDLGNLRYLLIGGTNLARLPDDVFSGLSELVILFMTYNRLTELPASLTSLSRLEDLILDGNQVGALPEDLFTSLGKLRFFWASGNQLAGLPAVGPGSTVEHVGLNSNNLTELPTGWLGDASKVRLLFLNDNRIQALEPGAFSGATRVTDLHLEKNQLTALPDGIFDGMANLRWLFLSENRLTKLPEGIFADQSKVWRLFLDGNELEDLPPGLLSSMPRLQWLGLDRNRIGRLGPDTFSGLGDLERLWLTDNRLTELPTGVFAGLGKLSLLALAMNQLAKLPTDIFGDARTVEQLFLQDNQLTELPERMFVGLSSLKQLSLEDNPGSPFGIALALSRSDGSNLAPGPARVSVTAASGAPFTMRVPVSVQGGESSQDAVVLRVGGVRSRGVEVTLNPENGNRGTQVNLGPVPGLRYGFAGIKLEIGDPLVLFGELSNLAPIAIREIPWQRLMGDSEPRTLGVSPHFRDPDGDALEFEIGNRNPAVASVELSGDRLSLTPHTAGNTEVTVKATDPEGLATELSFPVSVRASVPGSFDLELLLVGAFTEEEEATVREAVDWWRSVLGETELPDVPLPRPTRLGCHGVNSTEPIAGPIDDLLVLVTLTERDGPGGVLAAAAPCAVREGSLLPFVGIVLLDRDDFGLLENAVDRTEVVLHEIGHVLGIGTLWDNLDLLANPSHGRPGADTHFKGRLARAAFDAAGGTSYERAKVPVENSGQTGSADGHWRQGILLTELMTPYTSLGVPDPMSLVTVQSLADMGYTVRTELAEPYRLPVWATYEFANIRLLHLGDDVIRGPVTVVDENGRTVGSLRR